MRCGNRPILLSILLLSLLVRVTIGAPCCFTGEQSAHAGHPADTPVAAMHAAPLHGEHDAHASDHHAPPKQAGGDSHSQHGEDNTAKPCCSACGPTLPGSDVVLAARTAPATDFAAQQLRDLAPPAPFPAYEARGPPHAV